ncbi:hypothetical protein [Chryseobacterium sp. SL1]|uniref:hypothetical protein n=1 Tax=Chryseobacterium sp. SL1 TaxID=2995159 RepID=UPI0022760567|nr:hypothetical protein [Chryseobacterium sp. SL1]MCY1660912.1 hypothetical protein [Chryseobacterium sp. SL1]
MKNPVVEKFMQEVFEKGKSESGFTTRNGIVTYIQDCIEKILGDKYKNEILSSKTLERYHQVYMEKKDHVDGFKAPDEHFKYQLAKYLGYDNYYEYMAHIYRDQKHKTVFNITDNGSIHDIETMNGDIIINRNKKSQDKE